MSHPVRLADLQRPHILRLSGTRENLQRFAALPEIAALGWPLGVVEQWLQPFLDRPHFVADYACVDLAALVWRLEDLPTADFLTMTTGASEADLLEHFAGMHAYKTNVAYPARVREAWETAGSWLVPPVILDRALLAPPASGLQVVEGRTRVGILLGRVRDGLNVAATHSAWVGR